MLTIQSHRPVYWECTADGHNKFWAAQIIEEKEYVGSPTSNGRTTCHYRLVRKWGMIGTEGQKMEQVYDDRYEVERVLDKLIWDKENKGYKPIF